MIIGKKRKSAQKYENLGANQIPINSNTEYKIFGIKNIIFYGAIASLSTKFENYFESAVTSKTIVSYLLYFQISIFMV